MDFMTMAIVLGFVVLNTVLSYNAGKKEGIFIGMISITQFYKRKSALKDKQSILGFDNWPIETQAVFMNPDPSNFED